MDEDNINTLIPYLKRSDMNRNHYCVILAGGLGSRLWPSSRQSKPKQFLDVLGVGKSLLRLTYDRFAQFMQKENIIVVTNVNYADLVREQIPELSASNLLLEPMKRNNVPAAVWASLEVCRRNPNASMIISPCDQKITDEESFALDVTHALEYARTHRDRLVTMGVRPQVPSIHFGYIQIQDEVAKDIYTVQSFTEKPELDYARIFMESGEFLWNTGLFVWTPDAFTSAIVEAMPMMGSQYDEIMRRYRVGDNVPEVVERIFSRSPNLTIEESVLEKSTRVDVMLCHFVWVDIGSWRSVHHALPKDDNKNVIIGSKSLLYDCKDCIIKLPKGHVAVIEGLEDYVVVDDNNVLVICKKSDAKAIRKYVNDAQITFGDDYV